MMSLLCLTTRWVNTIILYCNCSEKSGNVCDELLQPHNLTPLPRLPSNPRHPTKLGPVPYLSAEQWFWLVPVGKIEAQAKSWTDQRSSPVVCPRNNEFFSVRTQTKWNSICLVCFSVCFAKPKNIFSGLFWFVLVFWTGIETTETNRSLSKLSEKISKKRSLLGCPRNS